MPGIVKIVLFCTVYENKDKNVINIILWIITSLKISRNKKQYLDLLLLGDEQEIMIDRYLERGDLFVLEDNGIKAVCVVTKEGPKNL